MASIRDTLDAGDRITAYCGDPCWHSADLDLQALGERFGFHAELSHWTVTPHLRCTACGKKGGTIRCHQTYKPSGLYDTGGRPVSR